MNKSLKLNIFFSNLNLVLIFIGYPLVTSILIPITGNVEGSQAAVTIPFRMISLGITIIVLFLNVNKTVKISLPIKLFFLFWFLLIIRMYYDLELRTEYFIPTQYKIKVWLYALAICLFPMISLVVSFKSIDFSKCLKYIFVLNTIILIISLFTTINGASADERIDGNIALDSISFGQIAIFATLISLYRLITEKNNSLVSKIIFICSAFLGLFIALKTGSRGPLLALFIVLIFWYSFKAKKIIVGYFKFTFLVSLMLVFMAVIFKIIGVISPLTAARFNQATDGTDMSVMNRTESYIWFYHKIMESPIIGSQFARLSNGDYPGYAHNIFLDVLLCFGVIGLSVFLYIIYNALRSTRLCIVSNENYWVGLIFIEFFMLSLTSGAYYSTPELNCGIVLILLISKNQYKELVN